jgi:hypothetical protein
VLSDRGGEPGRSVRRCEVGGEDRTVSTERGQLSRERVGFGPVPMAVNADVVAVAGESKHRRPTDAAGSAGDEGPHGLPSLAQD